MWRFVDGKPGHESQSQGLIDALSRKIDIELYEFSVKKITHPFCRWVSGNFERPRDCPNPHYLVGAGHQTHLPLLAARRAFGGEIIVLMRPTLPLFLFDWIVMPDHDGDASPPNVIITKGVLNTIKPSEHASKSLGLILIGGPSKHSSWSDRAIVDQVQQVLRLRPEVEWTLTTSRRTPKGTLEELFAVRSDNLKLVPFENTGPGWVGDKLSQSGHVWVSEDSISMIYEALTSGAEVGLLEVPNKKKKSRVVSAVEILKQGGRVALLGSEAQTISSSHPLAEADRVTEELMMSRQ